MGCLWSLLLSQLCEIVVGQGEYLYRKGSDLIWTSAVLLVRSRHRVSGVRVISSFIIGSLLCSIVFV
jgi:hypothetical protein